MNIPPFLIYPFLNQYSKKLESLGVEVLEEDYCYTSAKTVKFLIEDKSWIVGYEALEGLKKYLKQDGPRITIFDLRTIKVDTLKIEVGNNSFDLDYILYNNFTDYANFMGEGYTILHRIPLEDVSCAELAEYASTCYQDENISYDEVVNFENECFEYFHEKLKGVEEHFKYLCNKYATELTLYLGKKELKNIRACISIDSNTFNSILLTD